jgi:protein involved in polysaccharide export with SLBB domain
MTMAKRESDIRSSINGRALSPSTPRLSVVPRHRLFIALTSLAAVISTPLLSQTSTTAGTQAPAPLDCSDPLMAGSSKCSSQIQEPGGQATSPAPGAAGTQSQYPNSNDFDIEHLPQLPAAENRARQVQFPPEPLTEFQKFVASTTGEVLPVFGSNLFQDVPSTFAPLDMAAVPPDFVIGPGDELRIRVWGQINFQANLRVDRSGQIFLPQVGPVQVAGLTYSDLAPHLRSEMGHVYRNFDLSADIGQIHSVQVYVSGQARRPGLYTVSSLSTLLSAIFACGGPSLQGSMRDIQLRRGSMVVTSFDLYDMLVNGDKSKDVKLESGDVIFIPPVGAQAAIVGSVRVPAIYELRPNESLNELLAGAGNASSLASQTRISIERIDNHRDRLAIEVAYDAGGLATPMADGDLVRLFPIGPKYQKTVIIRGNIANPGRFAWHPGMHISELIPDKDSLITTNYWWRRAQLGLPTPEFEPDQGLADQRQPHNDQPVTLNLSNPGQTNAQATTNSEWGQNQSGQNQSGQSGSGQSLTGENLSAQQRSNGSSLAATQSTELKRTIPSTQRTDILKLAPEIDWDYAAIERIDPETLKTTVMAFDLGKLVLQHDASQDLELEPGDVVSVFSEADIRLPVGQQTKLVRLDGEFEHAGVYTAQEGETLHHLVERAGGITSNAYLYGSEFTRESARSVQQARIDEYVQSLAMRIQRGSMELASSPSASAQALAGGAAESSERDLIASLREIRATGRIVLRFTPNSSGISSIPDIPLEDGDHFVVPPIPKIVNVVGSVYDQSSFLFSPGRDTEAYLHLAGGPNRDADRRHSFIIRADGEVVSEDSSKGLLGSDFNNLRIYPGDTIVVPEKTLKPSALRDIIDWSQVFSQFALGAAALNVIR